MKDKEKDYDARPTQVLVPGRIVSVTIAGPSGDPEAVVGIVTKVVDTEKQTVDVTVFPPYHDAFAAVHALGAVAFDDGGALNTWKWPTRE